MRLKCDNYVQQIPICVHALIFPFELEGSCPGDAKLLYTLFEENK